MLKRWLYCTHGQTCFCPFPFIVCQFFILPHTLHDSNLNAIPVQKVLSHLPDNIGATGFFSRNLLSLPNNYGIFVLVLHSV